MSAAYYSAESWRALIASLIASVPTYANIDVRFAMAWLTMESGGNPCAVGSPAQMGPDGFPREVGLGQLYNPDDFARQHVTTAPFRAYSLIATAEQTRTAAASYASAMANGDHTAANAIAQQMQTCSRPLTDAEKEQQVRCTLLTPIMFDMAIAHASVVAHGLAWSAPDVWKLVKASHALPGILGQGMPAVCVKLGRPPVDWNEFRQVLGMDANSQWDRALNACAKCGDATA